MNIYIYIFNFVFLSLYKKRRDLVYKGSNRESRRRIERLPTRKKKQQKKINQHLQMLHSFPLLEPIFDVIRDNFHKAEDRYD
jgi:hypothetical protein